MRLSGFCLAASLLFSSMAFAQHHDPGAPPSSPAPSASAAPSAAPSTHSSPPPSAPSIPTSAPSMSTTHNNAPSAPAPVSIPQSHTAPSASRLQDSVTSTASHPAAEQKSPSHGEEVVPEQKVAGENKIVPDRRVGENPPVKGKPVESDLRRRVCDGGPCKESLPKTGPPESDLTACVNGKCKCPPGQTAGKGGCVSTATTAAETPCPAGMIRNGTACAPTGNCPAGQTWNGANCVTSTCAAGQVRLGISCQADCSTVNAQAQSMIPSLRSARQDRDEECTRNPSGTLCQQLDGHYHANLGEYENLFGAAPAECRTTLPVPETL
jgi:hypothetical protein